MVKLIDQASSSLLVIDAQEKLMPAIDGAENISGNIEKLLQAAVHLTVPIIMMEQYPDGLGATIAPLKLAAYGKAEVISKTSFSCAHHKEFSEKAQLLKAQGRGQFIVTGAEAHVCVLQSALELQQQGYDVFVVVDGIGSRAPLSHEVACQRMLAAGLTLVTTEMVLYEWIGHSDCAAFKTLRSLLV